MGYIRPVRNADLLIVARPARTTVKIALGMANDLIGPIVGSTLAWIVVVPVMEEHMLHYPAAEGRRETPGERSDRLHHGPCQRSE